MIVRQPDEAALASPLGRVSPMTKLAISIAWLVGLAAVVDARPPLILGGAAAAAGLVLGGIGAARLVRSVAGLWLAALGIGLFNALFAAANADPGLPELVRLGPLRVTEVAAAAGAALGLRVFAIATLGVVFGLTTDSTRLVDALVQQAGLSDRFGYGALAAYQAVPRLAEDLTTLRQARRIRGLRGSWHPRLLVGLLVLAIRHGDRLALAMDARGFGSGPRSRYRVVRWGWLDAAVALGASIVLGLAVASPRIG
jgi:energy-coupling factor transporter transmembrane protein EcfT